MRETLVKTEEFKDSPVGKIPKHWDVVPLERVCLNVIDCPHTTPVFRNDGVLVARTSNIRNGNFDVLSASFVSEQEYRQRVARLEPQPGDVIFTREAPVGEAFIVPVGMRICLGQRTMLLRPDPAKAISSYVLAQIYSGAVRTRIEQLVAGTTNPHLNVADVRSFLIPVPTLQEQCRIAEILEAMDKAIAHTSSLIAKLKQMKAGLLHDLLTRGLDENGELRDAIAHPEQFKPSPLGGVPKDWEAEPFGEHIGQLDSGWSPVCDSEPAVNGEWGILKTTAVVWSGYNPLENKKLPSNLQPRYQAVVEVDDILITRKGPRERVGVVVHIPLTPPQLMMPDTVFRVRLKESSTLLPAFVPLALSSVAVQRDWNRKKIGLAEAQVDINYGIVRETLIYLPPKPEQERIVGIINNYNIRIRTEEAYRDKLKLQKQGLMHDLLTGKVRVKNA